jgi:rhodanese-related sulfurtransferase
MSFLRRHGMVLFAILVSIVIASPVHAVPPPDFIINVGSQMAQFFSLALLFLTAIFSSIHQFLRTRFVSVRLQKQHVIGAFIGIVLFAGLGATVFGMVLEKRALARLMLRSESVVEEGLLKEPVITEAIDLDKALSTGFLGRPEIPTIPPLDEEMTSAVLAATTAENVRALPVATTTTTTLPFKLSNDRLRTLLKSPKSSYIILDAREDLEYEYGQFPGSIHIRYADLKAGRWAELPTDRPIVVLCWSGIRGSQVAAFLRDKRLAASYLAEGANGWVTAKGAWQGSIKFAERFPEERYRIAFSKEETMRRVQGGAVLIDAREPADRTKRPLANAMPISLLSTPSVDLLTAYASIPAGKAVITVCSTYVDCFEAKLVGVETERRGHVFLGRYLLQ